MHGLASLLPQPYYAQVEALWQEMEEQHGLTGIRVTPYPHFSWQIAQDYDPEKLERSLQRIADRTPPFTVRTTGLGLFSGLHPVLFIPVIKDAGLVRLHEIIWQELQDAAQGLSPYYSPSAWVPHISLAYEDLTPTNIGPILQSLLPRPFNWEMTIDNLAFIYEPDGEIGEVKLVKLAG